MTGIRIFPRGGDKGGGGGERNAYTWNIRIRNDGFLGDIAIFFTVEEEREGSTRVLREIVRNVCNVNRFRNRRAKE